LVCSLALAGHWQPEDAAHLRALWVSVADTDLGRALGLPAAEPSIGVDESAEQLTLRLRLPGRAFAEALVRVFAADLTRLSPGSAPAVDPSVSDGDTTD
jgi:hypothetical protein